MRDSSTSGPATVDALLAELKAAEMDDIGDLLIVRSGLAQLAEEDESLSPAAKRFVLEAANRLDAAIAGEGQEALDGAIRLLSAMAQTTESEPAPAAGKAAASPSKRPRRSKAPSRAPQAALSATPSVMVESVAPPAAPPPKRRSKAPSLAPKAASRSPKAASRAPNAAISATPSPKEKSVAPPAGPIEITRPMGDEDDEELMNDFVTEASELLANAEGSLLALEADPDSESEIASVFRAFHTIKGVAGMLNLEVVQGFAHSAENLLSRMRDGELRCTGAYATLALRSVDMLQGLTICLSRLSPGESAPAPEGLAVLRDALRAAESAPSGAAEEPVPQAAEAAAPAPSEAPSEDGASMFPMTAPPAPPAPEPEPATPSRAPRRRSISPSKKPAAQPASAAEKSPPARRPAAKEATAERNPESMIRVRTDRLDRLIDIVGELVIAQSMVAEDPTILSDEHLNLHKKISHETKIIRDLQELTMSLRMVPLRPTFQKMSRLVRDIALKEKKAISFESEGEDTEIDRNMVDIVADPLVHLIRNATDHGIESPQKRKDAGKPEKGTIRLAASHSGGNVVVEIQDDGNGISRAKVAAKAVSKGLIATDEGMTDSEVLNLIFEPGFSTNEQVTDISGRGVGMDVVRRGIEALNGRIDIHTREGHGTTFTVYLPLTLAITDGMLVRVGAEKYIVPTGSISMSLRPEPGAICTLSARGELLSIRNELVPLVRLHHLLAVPGAQTEPYKALVVVVDDGQGRCALMVDEILGQQQVVTKSLGDNLGSQVGVAGGAVLGDGRVGLILDAVALSNLSRQSPSWVDEMAPTLAEGPSAVSVDLFLN